METVISNAHKQMLWKDELGDSFILLKFAEVYRYSDKCLRLLIFSRQKLFQLQKMGVIINLKATDDPLYIVDMKRKYLPLIISLGAFKRRPHKNGKWIKTREALLGHKILPYRCSKLNKAKLMIDNYAI